MSTKTNAGFTLIELMIVTEIIAIIMALAIPALLRQRIQTNEAAAVQNLRTLSTAQISFNTVNLRYGTFEELCAGTGSTRFLDGTWAENVQKHEYIYNEPNLTMDTFKFTARPLTVGRTGIRTFSVDESGFIRVEE